MSLLSFVPEKGRKREGVEKKGSERERGDGEREREREREREKMEGGCKHKTKLHVDSNSTQVLPRVDQVGGTKKRELRRFELGTLNIQGENPNH